MRNKIIFVCLLILALCALSAFANQDIDQHRMCEQCGMDRKQFGYSRMLVVYQDGSQVGLCSLHCAVTEMNVPKDKKVKTLLVADRDTRQLIEADQAIWVMGGSKRGVMTDHPKWAFAERKRAEAFIRNNGGQLTTLFDVVNASRTE